VENLMRMKNVLVIAGAACAGWMMLVSASALADDQTSSPPPPPPRDRSDEGAIIISGGPDGPTVLNTTTRPANLVFDPNSDLVFNGNGVLHLTGVAPATPARAAYLGITTSSPDTALQKQLQLKPGVGLVVDSIEPGSPAEKAGVKQYDVLHKLDDQLMINAEQFIVLVRSYEPGKEVKLTLIREGKEQTITAKLGEHAVQPLRLILREPPPGAVAFQNIPQLAPLFTTRPVDAANVIVSDGKSRLSAAQIAVDDGKHKLTISTTGGHKHMQGEDKATRKIVFDLPIDTKDDLEKVPAEYRKLYQELLLDNPPPTTTPSPTAPR